MHHRLVGRAIALAAVPAAPCITLAAVLAIALAAVLAVSLFPGRWAESDKQTRHRRYAESPKTESASDCRGS